jgi:HEPN domain-containing protein
MDEKIQQWLRFAESDFDSAGVLHRAGQYPQAIFHLQQAVEKTLKALILKRSGAIPPRIHSLPKLVRHLGLELPREQMLLLQDLTRYYAGSRYPEGLGESPLEVEAPEVDRFLSFTEEFISWLKQKL